MASAGVTTFFLEADPAKDGAALWELAELVRPKTGRAERVLPANAAGVSEVGPLGPFDPQAG